jgi:uncharacterized Zn finger protein
VTPQNPSGRSSGWGSDGWRGDGFPPPSKPLPVKDGLVARSARGGIGQKWWSRRFIEVMESLGVGGRLTRGRNYARKGQVISLEVEPGEVIALVQGSRVTPYRVRIGLSRFTELVWAKVEVVLAEQAIHSARLLAGEFPPELEPVFSGIGAPLFPVRLGDLELDCSCPDYVVPCKHLAAVFYLLAERFDDDPFLILRWRGRPREVLLRRLRELRGDETPGQIVEPAPDDRPVLSARLALDVLDAAGQPSRVEDEPEDGVRGGVRDDARDGDDNAVALRFWTAGQTPPLPSQPELPVDLLLRLLPVPTATLGGIRLLAQLGPFYHQLTEPTPETYRGVRHGNLGL